MNNTVFIKSMVIICMMGAFIWLPLKQVCAVIEILEIVIVISGFRNRHSPSTSNRHSKRPDHENS